MITLREFNVHSHAQQMHAFACLLPTRVGRLANDVLVRGIASKLKALRSTRQGITLDTSHLSPKPARTSKTLSVGCRVCAVK